MLTITSSPGDTAANRRTLKSGDIIGNYRVLKLLGCGNYGCVYKVEDIQTHGTFALKLLHGEPSPKRKRELKKEAEIQTQLIHKNIVRCFRFEPDAPEGAFIVLDYVDGCSLGKVLKDRPKSITFEKAHKIVESCLEALDCAHTFEKGIVHGDVKPGNILIPFNVEEEVRLGDFGVARVVGTSSVRRKGSSSWAAPELLKEWEKNRLWDGDKLCDLFSVGIVAYYLLANRHPFGDYLGRNLRVSDLILDIECEAPPLRRLNGVEVPERCEGVVAKLLRKDRKYRCQSAREALTHLKSVGVSQRTPTQRPSSEPTRRDIKVNLNFLPRSPGEVDLDVDDCSYEIRDGAEVMEKGRVALAMLLGGWQCTISTRSIDELKNPVVMIHLVEKKGKRWEVRPFYPNVINQNAMEVE